MQVGQVTQLWRYPVKSMMGEQVGKATLGPLGLVGDRTWATRDEVRGGIRGAKKLHGLMKFGARYLSEPAGQGVAPAEITLPDGSVVMSDAPDASARVSDALGHLVTLWPLQPPEDLDHYRRGPADSDDALGELRELFVLGSDDPLPDLSVFPPVIFEFESPPGTYVDAYPLLLLTEQSIAGLQTLAADSVIDVRRFRPNLLVDATASADGDFPEQAWVGRRLQIGGTVLEVVAGCPRCVMTTLAFGDLPADRRVISTLARETGQLFGVYAEVAEPGGVQIGDAVTLLPA